jgi:hypothetical protein
MKLCRMHMMSSSTVHAVSYLLGIHVVGGEALSHEMYDRHQGYEGHAGYESLRLWVFEAQVQRRGGEFLPTFHARRRPSWHPGWLRGKLCIFRDIA